MIYEAIQFAKEKHKGQTRKYSGDPYIIHPCRVAATVAILDDMTECDIAIAYLHDTLEDTDTTFLELSSIFNKYIANGVTALSNVYTKEREPFLNRKERNRLEHKRLSRISICLKEIKLADRYDNIKDMGRCPDIGWSKKYARETLELLEALQMHGHILHNKITEVVNDILKEGK